MDFVNMPYNNYGMPMNVNGTVTGFSAYPNQQYQNNPQAQFLAQQEAKRKLMESQTPTITTGGFKLNVVEKSENTIPVEPINDAPRRGRPKKESTAVSTVKSTDIVRASDSEKVTGVVEATPTAYTYMETTGMLRETLAQIDSLNSDLMQEFETVRHNRTMKNKYNVLVGLSENVGSLLNNKISAIREINSSISKSNDLDYKKAKDVKAAASEQDADKYIADLYQSFLQSPQNVAPTPQYQQVNPSIFGSSIIRADIKSGDINSNNVVDADYLSYLSNLSPEQNMMRYENDPNVKEVVVFDESTGGKFFQVMNMATGQVIPNVPTLDQMFMEDVTLDLKTGIAKSINLNRTFPIVTINKTAASQY